jgi:hypothetical protein
MYGTEKKRIQGFGGKGTRLLGRPMCRWKGSIKMYLTEV